MLNFTWFTFLSHVTARRCKIPRWFAFVVHGVFLSGSASLHPFRFANKIREFRSVMEKKRSERQKRHLLILDCEILLPLRVARSLWEFSGTGRKSLRSSWGWTASSDLSPIVSEVSYGTWKFVAQKTKRIFFMHSLPYGSFRYTLCTFWWHPLNMLSWNYCFASNCDVSCVFCVLSREPYHGFITGSYYPSRWGP